MGQGFAAPGDEVVLRCRATGLFPMVWALMVVAFTVFGVVMLAYVIADEGTIPLPFLGWWAVLAWFWYVVLVHISFEVTVFESGQVEFRSLLRRWRVGPGQVRSIGAAGLGLDPYTVTIQTSVRTARVIRSMDGFTRLVTLLQELNPRARVTGV